VTESFEFKTRLDRLIRRVEAWNYAESDAGAGLPVEIAQELALLAADAPTPSLRQAVRAAQDGRAEASVVRGGLLGARKGISVPGRTLPLPALTEKDV